MRYQIVTSAPDSGARDGAVRPAMTGRAATIGRLADELGALVAAGDLEAAREVHETIGRLLAPMRSAGEGARGAVAVDLEAERRARR